MCVRMYIRMYDCVTHRFPWNSSLSWFPRISCRPRSTFWTLEQWKRSMYIHNYIMCLYLHTTQQSNTTSITRQTCTHIPLHLEDQDFQGNPSHHFLLAIPIMCKKKQHTTCTMYIRTIICTHNGPCCFMNSHVLTIFPGLPIDPGIPGDPSSPGEPCGPCKNRKTCHTVGPWQSIL